MMYDDISSPFTALSVRLRTANSRDCFLAFLPVVPSLNEDSFHRSSLSFGYEFFSDFFCVVLMFDYIFLNRSYRMVH
jgi:hypothetical protein